MKLHNTKILGGFAALLVSASVLAACSSDGTDTDGTGGEGGDGPSTGGTNDGTGGEATGGTATGGETSTGGQGEGGEGGEGTGGEPAIPQFEKTAKFLLDNAINAYGTLLDTDGKIYISGVTDTGAKNVAESSADLRLAVWRLNSNGSLDATWGTEGKLTSAIVNPGTSYDIVKLADGSFVVHYSGSAGVSLVTLSAAGVFGTPVTLEFGWSADDRADLEEACDAAAATDECVEQNDALAVGGVCRTGDANFDADACALLVAACEATEEAVACEAAWPSVTSPLFAQRPGAAGSWGVGLDTSDTEEKIVVFAHGPAAKVSTGTQRTDNDRYITRVLASDFSVDEDFNDGAAFTMDPSDMSLGDNSRRGIVEADGSIVSAGYTNLGNGEGVGLRNHIILIRLNEDGTPDEDFGFDNHPTYGHHPGQTLYAPYVVPTDTTSMAEAYGVAGNHTDGYITSGYGTSNFFTASIAVDLVFTKYNPADDNTTLDATFGGNEAGTILGAGAIQSEEDPEAGLTGFPYEERGRHIQTLSEGRTVHAGAYNGILALFVIDEEGGPDASMGNGSGMLTFDWDAGRNFFGLAVSADSKRIVATSSPRAKAHTAFSNAGVYAKTYVAIVDLEDVE